MARLDYNILHTSRKLVFFSILWSRIKIYIINEKDVKV